MHTILILRNPQTSGASLVYTTFPQITQKILTIDKFYGVELITVTLLWVFRLRKATIQFFDIPKNLEEV